MKTGLKNFKPLVTFLVYSYGWLLPVAVWLRVACSYIKRNCEQEAWNVNVSIFTVKMINYVDKRVDRKNALVAGLNIRVDNSCELLCNAT